MNSFFISIFLLSPIFLIIGLIRPKIFRMILRSTSRKRVGLVFISITLVSFIGIASTIDKTIIPQSKITSLQPVTENDSDQIAESVVPTDPNILDSQESVSLQVHEEEKPVETMISKNVVTQNVVVPPILLPAPVNQPAAKDAYRVVSVVDGDTIKVLIDGSEKTVRLIGIDTPETVDPRKTVQCFGKEASDKAKTTLLNKNVRLEADSTQGDTDKYQRLLRYVYLDDGTFFNEMMVKQGYAHEYTYSKPYKYQIELKAAQKAAQDARAGLWSPSTCNGSNEVVSKIPEPLSSSVPAESQQTNSGLSGGHVFYLSTYHTAKLYYCDTDEAWKSLSKSYLKKYSSEKDILSDFPTRTLHEACK